MEKVRCCFNCRYCTGLFDDGKCKCNNKEQWNTWIKPEQGCERWEENHNDN